MSMKAFVVSEHSEVGCKEEANRGSEKCKHDHDPSQNKALNI